MNNVYGNEVATHVYEVKSAGVYEVEFDASVYSNGVDFLIKSLRAGACRQFYRCEKNDFTQISMSLMKVEPQFNKVIIKNFNSI